MGEEVGSTFTRETSTAHLPVPMAPTLGSSNEGFPERRSARDAAGAPLKTTRRPQVPPEAPLREPCAGRLTRDRQPEGTDCGLAPALRGGSRWVPAERAKPMDSSSEPAGRSRGEASGSFGRDPGAVLPQQTSLGTQGTGLPSKPGFRPPRPHSRAPRASQRLTIPMATAGCHGCETGLPPLCAQSAARSSGRQGKWARAGLGEGPGWGMPGTWGGAEVGVGLWKVGGRVGGVASGSGNGWSQSRGGQDSSDPSWEFTPTICGFPSGRLDPQPDPGARVPSRGQSRTRPYVLGSWAQLAPHPHSLSVVPRPLVAPLPQEGQGPLGRRQPAPALPCHLVVSWASHWIYWASL